MVSTARPFGQTESERRTQYRSETFLRLVLVLLCVVAGFLSGAFGSAVTATSDLTAHLVQAAIVIVGFIVAAAVLRTADIVAMRSTRSAGDARSRALSEALYARLESGADDDGTSRKADAGDLLARSLERWRR